MKKVEFPKSFYKVLYDAVFDYCKDHYEYDETLEYPVSIDIDEYEIELTACVEVEWEDESFDHAFGTWHDPNAGYVFSDVEFIDDVHVYVEGEEVEGFSIDEYNAQFIENEHKGIKRGDKVYVYYNRMWHKEEYEVVYYNNRSCEFLVKSPNGYHKNLSRSSIRKVV